MPYMDDPIAALRAAEERRQLEAAIAAAAQSQQVGQVPVGDEQSLAFRNMVATGGASMGQDPVAFNNAPTASGPLPAAAANPMGVLQSMPSAIPGGEFSGSPIPPVLQEPPTPPPIDPQTALRAAYEKSLGGSTPEDFAQRIESVRELLAPGPLQQRYMQAISQEQEPVNGFGGRVKSILKGLALNGLGGAVYGAIDPSSVAWSYRQAQAQNMLPGVQAENLQKDTQIKRAGAIGDAIGIDPITGLRTPMAEYRAALASKIPSQIANTNSLITNRAQGQSLRELNFVLNARRQGGALSQQEIEEIDQRFGVRLPPTFDPNTDTLAYDSSFNPIIVDKQTGIARPVMTEAGTPQQGSALGTQEQNRTTRAHIIAAGQAEGRALTRRGQDINAGLAERRLRGDEEEAAQKQAEKEVPELSGFDKFDPTKVAARTEAVKKRAEELKTEKRKQAGTSGSKLTSDPNIGKAVVQGSGPTARRGTIVGILPSGEYDIRWQQPLRRK